MMRDIFNKLRLKMFFLLTAVYLIMGFLGGLIFYYLFAEHYFKPYFVIVLFYWITGIITNYILDHTIQHKEDKLLSVYMVSRMSKFLLTIIFLAIFEKLIIDNSHKIAFALALMCNYILYTSLELYIYYLYNKRSIKNAKKE